MREKRLVAVIDRLKTRITPACAGKTLPFFGECTTSQDHPRVCGKNLSSKAASQRMVGSPPRVREKPTPLTVESQDYRITPACAGKTYINFLFQDLQWDHPRVCGKNNSIHELEFSIPGSPPRVREKLVWDFKSWLWLRITPACAGKTTTLHNRSKLL